MSKIIIDNRSRLNDLDAIELVTLVIKDHRNANNQNKHGFEIGMIDGNKYAVSTYLNKASDRFVISNYPK